MQITLHNYDRIHRVISAILRSEDIDTAHACGFFSVFGSRILQKHFKLDAAPVCGTALLQVGQKNKVLCFGNLSERGLELEGSNFHCWVEANGWFIDFMAPEFWRFAEEGEPIPSKMLQKPISDMATHPNELKQPGDFFLAASAETTHENLSHLGDKQVYSDLAEACVTWFQKYPKRIPSKIGIEDQDGKRRIITLSLRQVRSKW